MTGIHHATGQPTTGSLIASDQHQEIFERYLYAGAITQNSDAVAEMFTEDGIFEAPLVPDGHTLRRLVSRNAIRTAFEAYHREPVHHGTVNVEESTYVLHGTAEPDMFVAEIDTVFDGTAGQRTTMSLVLIPYRTGTSPYRQLMSQPSARTPGLTVE